MDKEEVEVRQAGVSYYQFLSEVAMMASRAYSEGDTADVVAWTRTFQYYAEKNSEHSRMSTIVFMIAGVTDVGRDEFMNEVSERMKIAKEWTTNRQTELLGKLMPEDELVKFMAQVDNGEI